MADPGVRIRIASEFVGKGFKDAGKATNSLDKSVKQLGKTLAGVFGAQQLLKFPDSYSLSVGGGLTSSNTSSGGFKIYTFTAGTGTVTFS